MPHYVKASAAVEQAPDRIHTAKHNRIHMVAPQKVCLHQPLTVPSAACDFQNLMCSHRLLQWRTRQLTGFTGWASTNLFM